jgi:hypothetical protein
LARDRGAGSPRRRFGVRPPRVPRRCELLRRGFERLGRRGGPPRGAHRGRTGPLARPRHARRSAPRARAARRSGPVRDRRRRAHAHALAAGRVRPRRRRDRARGGVAGLRPRRLRRREGCVRGGARAAWEAWAASALAAAAAAESSGAIDVALAELLPLVLAADERAARRFDALAPSTPEFLAELALAEVEGDAIGDRLERIRFLLALAARGTAVPTEPRADSSPPPLRAAALLDRALEDALAIEDARVASEMLLAVADALARFVPDRDLRPVLDAADDGLAVLSPDPETALRFARLAALAARHEDDATRQASFRSAQAAASRADPFARFSAAVFLADAGQLAEAFDAAYSLIGDPLRELAGLALAWVAWRAAEHDDTAIQRKAALAAEATMLDGSTPRGATALLQLMRADLLRDRVDTADERRLRISFAALRVAADCAFAEHLAAHDDESRASAILAAVDLAATTFGAGAVAEIAAARAADAPPSHLVRSALDLPRRDLRAAALGALSQTYAAR